MLLRISWLISGVLVLKCKVAGGKFFSDASVGCEWDSFDLVNYSSVCGHLFSSKNSVLSDKSEQSLLTNIKSVVDLPSLRRNSSNLLNDSMSNSLSDCNIYIFGNSVFRHYSFSLLAYLEGLPHDISVNRTAEKSSCRGSGPYSSCNHYSQSSQTLIRFFWNIKLGNNTCDDLRRDICYGQDDDNTTNCFVKLLKGSTSRDVLILGNIPANTMIWCQRKLNTMGSLRELFENYLKPNITSVDTAAAMARMALSVFPGRIVWLSYPMLNSMQSDPTVNDLILKVNRMVRDAVRLVNVPRIAYLNLAPLQFESLSQYTDTVHHPGPLSEKIIRLLAHMLQT